MARTHVWHFLVNQAGEPIENAKIHVYEAGTETPVWVYFDEFGSTGTRTNEPNGQVSTLENGYFEFWIDELEDFDPDGTVDNTNATSYGFNQKFKIRWEKQGIANGYIDYIDVFPPNRYFKKVDLSDCSSEALNKLVSNKLACKWDQHSEWDVRLDGLPVHGLEYVRVDEKDTFPNKIISNYYGWLWTQHEMSTVEGYSPSGAYGPPHDLHPVDIASSDNTFNKIVSNKLFNDLWAAVNATKAVLMTIKPAPDAADANWALDASGNYEATLQHNLLIPYPDVTCYVNEEVSPGVYEELLVKTADVIYLDSDNIKVRIYHSPVEMTVRITT